MNKEQPSSKMYVLYKCTWGDFDILMHEAIAVSTSQERLRIEAAELNARRPKSEFFMGEWKHYFEVSNKGVKVL